MSLFVCPHCGHEGRPVRAVKTRATSRKTWMCEVCRGEVEFSQPRNRQAQSQRWVTG